MQLTNYKTNDNYTLKQLKLPLVIEKLIDISDSVYTFCDVMDHIDLTSYFVEAKGYKTGRPRCDAEKLLKVILFAFMENGYCSLREIEKLCNNDIRFMYLLDEMKAPTFATFGNFIRNELSTSIEDIFNDINAYIFNQEKVDLNHTYIDGTKIEANANKYTWIWKKSCIRNCDKVFGYISALIEEMNSGVLCTFGVKIEQRDEYAIEYLEEIIEKYAQLTTLDFDTFVYGKGHRKTIYQRQYEKLNDYKERLKTYAKHIEVCGNERNSYSKTDHDASFMRIKTDYMEKFNKTYGHYPKYPVADAGYGSYNNYIYCEEHGMEKYMKFTMFKKETTDKKYRKDPYRIVNFKRDSEGKLLCPNGKRFIYKYDKHVDKNKYGRTEEIYECEDCTGCPYRENCCKKKEGNRTARLNRELTSMHEEVIENLESVHGALLRMNRSIQSEGTFGIIKWDRSYKRLFRRGLENVNLELTLIACAFNLYKYHNKRNRLKMIA